MSWSATDNDSPRMAIAQISELKIVIEEELARVFEVHVRSVRNYIQDFRGEGIQGLISQKSGPKESLTEGVPAGVVFKVLNAN